MPPIGVPEPVVFPAVERIERHDIINAIGLAAILLAMALALLLGAQALFNTVNGGLISSEKEESVEAGADTSATSDAAPTTTEAPEETTTTTILHLPNEVTARVGNGAGRGGIAGAGTALLDQAGYVTLGAKNAPATDASIIYYVEGYAGDAAQVARLLGVVESAIAPMPADPGIPIEGAQIVAILGADTTVG